MYLENEANEVMRDVQSSPLQSSPLQFLDFITSDYSPVEFRNLPFCNIYDFIASNLDFFAKSHRNYNKHCYYNF